MPRADLWTEEDTALARRLLQIGAKKEMFLDQLGRSRDAAVTRIKYVDNPTFRERTKQRAQSQKRAGDPSLHYVRAQAPVPARLLDDARRRLDAPRTLTSSFFGDPAPGQSALDKRNAVEARS
ncbi:MULTISPECIES: hypothetical protein [unclassified Bradyrhizobium]